MINGTFDPVIGGVYINGGYLVVNPETGAAWQNDAEAFAWWETSDQNPANQAPVEDIPAPVDHRQEIMISAITGTVRQPQDLTGLASVKVTALEGASLTLTGSLEIPDENFLVPFRQDGGRLMYFNAQVVDGVFSATLNFPESGRYTVDTDLLNAELTEPRFKSKQLVVYVMRKVAATD